MRQRLVANLLLTCMFISFTEHIMAANTNPCNLIINEAITRGHTFLELWTPLAICSLDYYSVIIGEMSTSKTNPALRVRVAIDLTDLKITQRQHFGLIAHKPLANGLTGIVPKTTKHFRFYGSATFTEEKWLQLKREDSFLVFLLLYSATEKVFDKIKIKPRHSFALIEKEEKAFIHGSLVDHLVITGPQGCQSCQEVNEVLGAMRPKVAPFDKFIFEHQEERQYPTALSVNRCGSVKPYDLR